MPLFFVSALFESGVGLAAKATDSHADAMATEAPAYPYASIHIGRGVDLVVSKVLFERGEFGGREQIKYKVWIRNICNEGVDDRIKVSLTDLGRAIWIEGGIAAGQTRESASYYMEIDEFPCCGSRVTVDSDNEIAEVRETNNTCGAAFSPATQSRNESRCWRGGIRCRAAESDEPRIPDLKLKQQKD